MVENAPPKRCRDDSREKLPVKRSVSLVYFSKQPLLQNILSSKTIASLQGFVTPQIQYD